MADQAPSKLSDVNNGNSEKLTAEKKHTASKKEAAPEIGGRKGPEPTRYGDWEKNGLISDF